MTRIVDLDDLSWLSAAVSESEDRAVVVEAAAGRLTDAFAAPKGFTDVRPIDWRVLWDDESSTAEDFLVEPLIPAGRQVAMYSPAKVGKSLLGLEVGTALATGRAVLGRDAGEPLPVVYLDMEMTPDDLRERAADLGYGRDSDLSRLAYYQFPNVAGLDTPAGGRFVEELIRRHDPVLFVADTMASVVRGPEDDSDTYRDFYRHTGRVLKEHKVALLRLDHSGKDGAKGQRGSSAKADDVDVVFQLSATKDTLRLRRTHSRVPWVPAEVVLTRQVDPVLRHVLSFDAITSDVVKLARLLDELNVPIEASFSVASGMLTAAGQGRRRANVLAALKQRKQRNRVTEPAEPEQWEPAAEPPW